MVHKQDALTEADFLSKGDEIIHCFHSSSDIGQAVLRLLLQGASALLSDVLVGALFRCARLDLADEVSGFAQHLAVSNSQSSTAPPVAALAGLLASDPAAALGTLEVSGKRSVFLGDRNFTSSESVCMVLSPVVCVM